MAVQVIDKATQQVVEVDNAEAQRGFQQGRYGVLADAPVQVKRGPGEIGEVSPGDLPTALAQGWELSDPLEQEQIKIQREESGLRGTLQGTAEAAAAGASLGLSTWALGQLGADPERMKARRKGLGAGATVAEVGGGLAALLASGGGSLLARGGAEAGAATRALGAVGAPTRALEGLGLATERAVGGALGGGKAARILAPTARGTVEGYFAGAGAAIDENVLGNREQTAESVFIDGGLSGALFGSALGLGMPIAADAAAGVAKVPASAMRRVLGRGTGAPGGETGELIAREMIDAKVPWRETAAEKVGDFAAKVAPLSSARPETARRAFSNIVKDPQRATNLMSRRNEIENAAAEVVGRRLDEVRGTLDVAGQRVHGASKYRRVAKDIPRNADMTAPRISEKLRSEIDDRLRGMEEINARTSSTSYDANAVRKARALVGRWFEESAANPKAIGSFQAADRFKKDLGLVIDDLGGFGKPNFGASSAEREAHKELRKVYDDVRGHLEREDVWGAGAKVQKQINAAFARRMDARRAFKEEARGSGLTQLFRPDGSVNMRQALHVVRQYGRAGGEKVANKLDDVLQADLDYLDTIRKHYQIDDDTAKAIREANDGVKQIRKEMAQQAKDAGDLADLMELRGAESGSSVSIGIGSNVATLGGALLGSTLGPVGAAAGAVMGTVLRPYTAARTLASLLAMADRVGGKRIGATGGLFARVAGPAAKRLRQAGDIKAPAIPVTPVAYASSKERSDKVDRVRRETAVLATRPDELTDRLRSHLEVVQDVAPGLSGEMAKVAQRAAMFLASKAPPTYSPPFSSRPPLVEPAAAERYLQYVEAVENPIETLARLDSGTFTVQHAEALRAVYPELYEQTRRDFIEALGAAQAEGHEVSYRDRLQLSVFLDVPATMSPDQFMILQASYGTNAQQDADEQVSTGRKVKAGSAGDMAQNDLTPTQRVESGMART